MKKLWRFLLKLEVAALAVLLGSSCPEPVQKYGPGPAGCTSFATAIADFLASPASILTGEQVLFTVGAQPATGENLLRVGLAIQSPSQVMVATYDMLDDGADGDVTASDGVYTVLVSQGDSDYPFLQAGTYQATVSLGLQRDDQWAYCERTARTEVEVE